MIDAHCIVLFNRKLVERRKDDDYEETEAEAIRQTAMDSEDVWEAEMEAFTPANRITGTAYRVYIII